MAKLKSASKVTPKFPLHKRIATGNTVKGPIASPNATGKKK